MPTKKPITTKKTVKSSRTTSPRFKPAPRSRFDALRKPALLIIITLAATVGVYFTFFASAATGNPAIVSTAVSQVGVHENPDGCNCGGQVNAYTNNHPEAWCADFVSWVYQQAGYSIGHISSTWGLRTFFQGHAFWHNRGSGDVPQPGDVITFSYDSHAGIVDHVDGSTLYTIEGNYSNSVARVTYPNYNGNGNIVGWGRLNSGSVVTSPPVGGNPSGTDPCQSQVLRQGSSGPCVVHLQNLLNGYGYHLTPDGSFGPLTNNAVRDFQAKHGLSAYSGTVETNTWNALRTGASASPPPAPAPSPSPAPPPPPPTSSNPFSCSSPHPTIQQGSSGTCVQYLQWFLVNKFGYGSIINPNGGTDGGFGPATKQAAQRFQFDHHVPNSACGSAYTSCDGQVGPTTWSYLEK